MSWLRIAFDKQHAQILLEMHKGKKGVKLNKASNLQVTAHILQLTAGHGDALYVMTIRTLTDCILSQFLPMSLTNSFLFQCAGWW